MAKRDYYEVLGVPRDASEEDLRKAFRRLAMEYHPDRNRRPDASDRFKEVNEAYQVLSDAQKRARYDRFGHAGVSGSAARDFEGAEVFSGFGDIFDSFFGDFMGHTQTRTGTMKGADLREEVTLTLEEAAQTQERVIEVTRAERCESCGGSGAEPGTSPVTCPTCHGSGQVRRTERSLFGAFTQISPCGTCRGAGKVIKSPCAKCRGAGKEHRKRRVEVQIPAGIEDGMRVRLSGEGDIGVNGGPAGDLYLTVHVAPHEVFQREGVTLLCEMPINYAQAVLGAEIEVPTLSGKHKLHIPAGTQPDSVFQIKGEGMPELNGRRHGDLLVRMKLVVPTSLDADQRKLVEELGRRLSGNGIKHSKRVFGKARDSAGGRA
jgi:molecular chaperone DnaJ